MKPKTGFELILNYSSHECPKKNLKNESSAGANAETSRINTAISATDPLSEIVWSPDKGFSLKCVDSSFTNKSTSLFRDVEPTSMVLALQQSVTCATDEPIDDVFVQPVAVICAKSNVSSTDIPARPPISESESADNSEKLKSDRGTPDLSNCQKKNLVKPLEKNICAQAKFETAKISETMKKENKSSTISGQIDRRPVGNLLVQDNEYKPSMEQNPSARNRCKEGMDIGVSNNVAEIEDGSYTKVEHMIEDKGSVALGTCLISSNISRSKKMELTAEKDLLAFNCEAATSAATSRILASKPNENKNKPKVNEMVLPYNKNDSHLSCDNYSFKNKNYDNYHSTEFFLASRKRCKQEVIIGSKKVKMQIQETSYSKSYVKRDSSFKNLSSNMMKRYSQSSQDEEKSLTLAHENSDRRVLWPDKNVGTRMCHQVGESSKDDVGSYLPPQIRPINFLNSHEHLKNNTLELYERKEMCHKSDTKEDLWLTRFLPKSTSPLMGFEAPSTYCSMLTHNHKHISHQNNCKVEKTRKQSTDNQLLIETEKLQNCCINKETSSIGVKDEKGNNDHISKHVTPFPRLRDSEPMVSMFAKRLGAIKQCKQTE